MDQLREAISYYLERAEIIGISNSLLDILLVTLVLFVILTLLRGTQGVQLLRGLILIAVAFFLLGSFIDLTAMRWLVRNTLPALVLAISVIFQPELRRGIEQVGNAGRYLRFLRRAEDDTLITTIANACRRLSNRRHGALIVIERETGLQEYIELGTPIDAIPTTELLLTIFNKETDLHDGAVIIREGRIAAASCVMPLSNTQISDRKMGLRHRAALGTSEVTDSVSVIVSEETGQISLAHNGRILRRQDPTQLESILRVFLQNKRSGSES